MTFFRNGNTYAVGFDKPMVASVERITEAVRDEGFDVLGAWECDTFPGLPFATPGKCGDGWDWVALIRRRGVDKWIDVPDRVTWVVEIPKAQQPQQPPALPGSPPPPPSPTEPSLVYRSDFRPTGVTWVAAASLLGAAVVGYWIGRRRRG